MILAFLALAAAQAPSFPSTPDPMPPRRTAPPASAPAPPAANAGDPRYRACIALVRSAPQQAVETANAWLAERGGLPARRCLGLAFAALEQWPAAATVFETAAREAETRAGAERADFLVQAGNAWLAAGDNAKALQAFGAALAVPDIGQQLRGGAHLDRARAQVALGRAGPARADIDRALQLIPGEPFAWYLSAALARREGNAGRAGTDIARARQLAPDDPDIVLLAGTIAGEAGDMAGAEQAYRRVVALAPDSEAGRAAAASLATVREVEVPAPAASPPAPQQQPQPQSR